MGVKHADLVDRLKRAVPCREGDEVAYEQAVLDAVAAYSMRVPLPKSVVLNIEPTVVEYALPADLISVTSIDNYSAVDGVLIDGAGITPIDPDRSDGFTVLGTTLIFDDEPGFAGERTLRYSATHVRDSSGVYLLMNARDAIAVALKAQADLLRTQAAAQSSKAWSYRIGDESVDKKALSSSMIADANSLEAQYERMVAQITGNAGPGVAGGATYGVRVRYS